MLVVFLIILSFAVILMPYAITESDARECVEGEEPKVIGTDLICMSTGFPKPCPDGSDFKIDNDGKDVCRASMTSLICLDPNGLDDYAKDNDGKYKNCRKYVQNEIILDSKQLDVRRSLLGYVSDPPDEILEDEVIAEPIPDLEPQVKTDGENYPYLWLEEIAANFGIPPSMIVLTYIIMGLLVIAVIADVRSRTGKRDQNAVSKCAIRSHFLRICGVISLISFLIIVIIFAISLFFNDDIHFLDSSLRSNFSFIVEPYYDRVYAPVSTTVFQPIYGLIINFDKLFLQSESPLVILLGTCFMIFPSFIIITFILGVTRKINVSKASKPRDTRFKNLKHHSATQHSTYSYEKDFSNLKFFK